MDVIGDVDMDDLRDMHEPRPSRGRGQQQQRDHDHDLGAQRIGARFHGDRDEAMSSTDGGDDEDDDDDDDGDDGEVRQPPLPPAFPAPAQAPTGCFLCTYANASTTGAVGILVRAYTEGVRLGTEPATLGGQLFTLWYQHVHAPAMELHRLGIDGAPLPVFYTEKSFVEHVAQHATNRAAASWTLYQEVERMAMRQMEAMEADRQARGLEDGRVATYDKNQIVVLKTLVDMHYRYAAPVVRALAPTRAETAMAAGLAAPPPPSTRAAQAAPGPWDVLRAGGE